MKLTDVIDELRKLNEPVPKPPRLPTEAEVAAAEQQLGAKFPADYRYFLLHAGDIVYGTKEPAMVTPGAGHLDLVEMAQAAWDEMDVPRRLLPFCEDNGDYFCLQADGKVVYWDHNGAIDETWPDLAHWIKQVWIEKN